MLARRGVGLWTFDQYRALFGSASSGITEAAAASVTVSGLAVVQIGEVRNILCHRRWARQPLSNMGRE
jgi:hypothetical protein